jgi:hypothetical protein
MANLYPVPDLPKRPDPECGEGLASWRLTMPTDWVHCPFKWHEVVRSGEEGRPGPVGPPSWRSMWGRGDLLAVSAGVGKVPAADHQVRPQSEQAQPDVYR